MSIVGEISVMRREFNKLALLVRDVIASDEPLDDAKVATLRDELGKLTGVFKGKTNSVGEIVEPLIENLDALREDREAGLQELDGMVELMNLRFGTLITRAKSEVLDSLHAKRVKAMMPDRGAFIEGRVGIPKDMVGALRGWEASLGRRVGRHREARAEI